MQHPACSVRTYPLRVGNVYLAIECFAIFALLDGCILLAYFLGDENASIWGLLFFAFLLAMLPLCLFLFAPRQIIRISERGIRIRSFGWGRSRLMRWADVNSCTLSKGFGIRIGRVKYIITPSSFHKADRERLREVLRALFESQLGMTDEIHRTRVMAMRPKMTWRWHILDKCCLVAVVVVPFGSLGVIFFAPNDAYWVALKCAIAVICLLFYFAVMRHQVKHFPNVVWHPV